MDGRKQLLCQPRWQGGKAGQEIQRSCGFQQALAAHGALGAQVHLAALRAEAGIPAAAGALTAHAKTDVAFSGMHARAHFAAFLQDHIEDRATAEIEGDGGRAQFKTLAVVAGACFHIGVASVTAFVAIAQVAGQRFRCRLQRARAGIVEPAAVVFALQRRMALRGRVVIAVAHDQPDRVQRGFRMPVALVTGHMLQAMQVDAGEPAVATFAHATGGCLQPVLIAITTAADP
ncbi:hypothetical protein D3C73_867370 [compost metagenome]